MRRIINIYLILSLLVIVFACEEDYEAPSEFSDIEVYVPEWSLESLIGAKMNVNNYFAFMDMSIGELSHEWSFEENSGCYFLKKNLPAPSGLDNYLGYIDENATHTTIDKSVAVIFTKAGLHGLRLYNTFKDSVGFSMIYENTKSALYDEDLGVWVIDTTFYVDVYDSIVPDFKILDHEGNEITLVKSEDEDEWVTATVEVGQTLTYTDITTIGRPDSRNWTFGSGTPASSTNLSEKVTYTNVTSGDNYLTSKLQSKRVAEDLPSGSTYANVPLIIKVVPPSANVEYISSSINSDGDLVLSFNQGVKLPDNSVISVTTSGVENAVTSVAYNSTSNKAVLVVSLTDIPTYGEEVGFAIAANTLISVYETSEVPKRNDDISEIISSNFGVAFEWDFESNGGAIPTSGTSADFGEWGFQNDENNVVLTTLEAGAYEGTYGGSFLEPLDNITSLYAFTPFFALEEGKDYRMDVFIKGSSATELGKKVKFYMRKGANNDGSLNKTYTLTDEYVKVSFDFTASGTATNFNIRLGNSDWDNTTGSRPINFDFDNLIVYEL